MINVTGIIIIDIMLQVFVPYIMLELDRVFMEYDFVGLSFLNPVYIYKHSKMNFFGVFLVTVFANIVFAPCAVCYWLYKLCTVGRR